MKKKQLKLVEDLTHTGAVDQPIEESMSCFVQAPDFGP